MRWTGSGRRWVLAVATAGVAMLPSSPAWADWIGEYWPLWVGNSWTFENVYVPGDTYTETVFEYLIYEGDQAVKLGRPEEYQVVGNTGHVITVYAEFEDGELHDYAPNIVVGEFGDGTVFPICNQAHVRHQPDPRLGGHRSGPARLLRARPEL